MILQGCGGVKYYVWEDDITANTELNIRYLEVEKERTANRLVRRLSRIYEEDYPFIMPLQLDDKWLVPITQKQLDRRRYTIFGLAVVPGKYEKHIIRL